MTGKAKNTKRQELPTQANIAAAGGIVPTLRTKREEWGTHCLVAAARLAAISLSFSESC